MRTSLVRSSKFNNQPTTIDGIRFASKKEAKRYAELVLLWKAGEIRDLTMHPRFDLRVDSVHVCRYIADFSYYDERDDLIVEDVKGMKSGTAYALFSIKRQLMLSCLGIEVREI